LQKYPFEERLPRKKYGDHKALAKHRNIEWEFDFRSWWKMWAESGKWELRGRQAGQFCMSRYDDIGPYSPSNCFIQLHSDNVGQGHAGKANPGVTAALTGRTRPQHVIDAISAANSGKKRSDEVKQRLSAAFTGVKRQRLPCPHCQQEKPSNRLFAHVRACEANPERTRLVHTEVTKQKMREAVRNRPKAPCPHCLQNIAVNGLPRHMPACEANPERTGSHTTSERNKRN
jgi:hypothetical protein